MNFRANKKRWRIYSGEDPDDPDMYGTTWPDERIILINPDAMKTLKHLLGTVVHEGAHAMLPYLSEQVIGQFEREMTDLLYGLDARVQPPPPRPKPKPKK